MAFVLAGYSLEEMKTLFAQDRAAFEELPEVFRQAIGKPHSATRALDWPVRVYLLPKAIEWFYIQGKDAKTDFANATFQQAADRFPDLSAELCRRSIGRRSRARQTTWGKVRLASLSW